MVIPSIYCFSFLYLVSFIIVMSSQDWFLVWLGLEINMMSFLMLIYQRYSMNSIEICLKYFFIQSLGSVLLISMFYLGKWSLGGLMVMVLSLKIGAGPFYFWFPPLCDGLDWFSCLILMLFQKVLPLLLVSMFIHWVMWIIICFSLIFGILGSFNQSSIKQLLAYSSVHHLGWIMLVMMKMDYYWFLYLIIYGFVLVSVIMVLMQNEVMNMTMLQGENEKIWFMLGMLSMAGVPPLLGFFLKWMALVFVVDISIMYLMMLVLVSVVMLYVYIRILYDVMMGSSVQFSWTCLGISKLNYSGDIMSVIGLFMGGLFGIFMMM